MLKWFMERLAERLVPLIAPRFLRVHPRKKTRRKSAAGNGGSDNDAKGP